MVLVAWAAVAAAGCAAVSGLDQIQEAPCAPECGTGHVAGDEQASEAMVDTSVDVRPEVGLDSQADRPAIDAPVCDSGVEAAADSGIEASFSPFDSGCGLLNLSENCSACGDTCAKTSTSVTSARCTGSPDGAGATCSYTCSTGYLDCNMATQPPDLDGCECFAPTATAADCCAGGCPVPHDNGLNQPTSLFYECSTSADTIAIDACAAFTGDASQCSDVFYCGSDPDASTTDLLVCSSGSATDCVCWDYSGPNAGYVHDSKEAPGSAFQNCDCPSFETDPSYL